MDILILLNRDQMGVGDALLGKRVLKTYLQKSIALEGEVAIAFYNSGVKLTAEDSHVLGELKMLHDRGVELLPCQTCVDHYGCPPVTGEVVTMDEIVQAMNQAAKVITL